MNRLGSFSEEFSKHFNSMSKNNISPNDSGVPSLNMISVELRKKESTKSYVQSINQLERERSDSKVDSRNDVDFRTLDLENKKDAKVISPVKQFLMSLIKKEMKTKRELAMLRKFLHDVPFFQKIAEKLSITAFNSLAKKISCEFIPSHRTVFLKGDHGTKFYIILQGQVALLGEKAGVNPSSGKPSHPGTPALSRKHSHEAKKPSIHAKQHQYPTSPKAQHAIKSVLKHESSFALRHSRRGSQDLRRLNLIDPAYGGSPRSNKNSQNNDQSNRNSNSESPKSKHSRMDSMSSPKGGSRGSAVVSQNQTPNKISFFGRAQPAHASTFKKATFGDATKEALESPRSHNGGHSSRKDSNISRSGSMDERSSEMITTTRSQEDFEEFLQYTFPYEKFIKSLGVGVGFGELALIGNSRRTATIVTMKDTHFAVLDKATYDEVLKDFHEDLYKEKLNFLQSIPMFQDWSVMKLSALLMIFDIKNISRNSLLYSTDDEAENIYFIRNGEVELIETISMQETKIEEQRKNFVVYKEHNPLRLKQSPRGAQIKRVIAKLGPGSIFGEEEVMEQYRRRGSVVGEEEEIEQIKRKYSAMVISSRAELYIVGKTRLFDTLKGSTAMDKFIEQYKSKKAWRNDYKKQINQSMMNIEEKRQMEATTPSRKQTGLNNQLKMINNRLVITSPKANKQDTIVSFHTEVNETVVGYIGNSPIYSPKTSPKMKSPKTVQDLNTTNSLLKRLDASQIKSVELTDKTSPTSSKSNLLKTRANLKNITSPTSPKITITKTKDSGRGSLLLSPKAPNKSTLQSSHRLNTIRSEQQSEIISDASPRISTSKPLNTFFDLEHDTSKYFGLSKVTSPNQSRENSRERSKRPATAQETINQQKFFGKQVSSPKFRKTVVLSSPSSMKDIDYIKTPEKAEKSKALLYSRISGLSEILSTSPLRPPTAQAYAHDPRLTTAGSAVSRNVQFRPSIDSTFDGMSSPNLDQYFAPMRYMSTEKDEARFDRRIIANNSLTIFPTGGFRPLMTPSKGQRPQTTEVKEVVNIHVQKLNVSTKQRVRVNGGFSHVRSPRLELPK